MPPATNAPIKLIPKKYSLRGPLQTQEIEDLFETIWKNKGTLVTSINSIATQLAAGDTGARGAEGDIQFNRGGRLWAEANLNWETETNTLRLRGVTTGRISFNPQNQNYQDVSFGAYYNDTYGYIPQSTNFSYWWNQPSEERFGIELVYDEVADAAAAFNKGIGFQLGTNESPVPHAFDIYQYGGLGTGAVTGLGIRVQNNDSGNGAAAWLGLANKDDTFYYVWPDASGIFRFHTARPTEDGTTVSDTVNPAAGLQAATVRVGENIVSPVSDEVFQIAANTPAATSLLASMRGAGASGAATGANLQSRGARGTIASPSALQTNDYIGGWFGGGYHSGGAYTTGNVAAIRMYAAENWTATANGTDIDFATTALGATSRTVKAIITSAGLLVIGTTKTSSFPALKQNSSVLDIKLADDSAYAGIRAAYFGAGANGDGTNLINLVGATSSTAPRNRIENTSTVQFSTTGYIMRNHETANGHEEFHFYAEKASAGAATGGSNFIIRRRDDDQSEATTHMIIDSSGNVYFNAGFTAGGGASLQGNVGIKTATMGTALTVIASGGISWDGRSRMYSSADGLVNLFNAAETGFTRLNLGGTSSSFPGIARSGAGIQVRLADNSNYSFVEASYFQANSGDAFLWASRSQMRSSADGVITMFNAANTSFSRLTFGGTSSSFPALKRNSAELQVRLADDSAYANIDANVYKTGGTAGVSGSFTTVDGKTVTVTNGIVTSIV